MSFGITHYLKKALKAAKGVFGDNSYKSAVQSCPVKDLVGPNWQSAAASIFPGQQTFQNCGVQSSRQIVEQALGVCLNKTELDFLNDAIATCGVDKGSPHPQESGGTGAIDRQCILKQYGVDSSVESASVSAVDNALRDRKGIIISADVQVLWNGRVPPPPPTGRHAVVLTHGDYDSNGNLTGVFVNDTGIGKRYRLSVDELEDVLDSGSGSINVTKKAIWPGD